MTDFADLARSVIDGNSYMVLGTADESGHPWVSPVWFATVDRRHFHWVSGHETRHSRNLEARQEIAIVIYGPSGAPGSAGAVYMSGTAKELTGTELQEGIDIFGRLSRTNAGRDWKTRRRPATLAAPPIPCDRGRVLHPRPRPRLRPRTRRRPPRTGHALTRRCRPRTAQPLNQPPNAVKTGRMVPTRGEVECRATGTEPVGSEVSRVVSRTGPEGTWLSEMREVAKSQGAVRSLGFESLPLR